ncbi:MAG TPA: hypothetical protein PL151_12105 [Phycisphaerae bacterium]|nr:hypothetical protein [Phycisphaerae bacterium]HPZ97484.1 hypothetical protein [Phycisphaerae bacterium]HQE28494.1 hypothetical protein [Phycisphaerae bacterium]
MSIRPLPYAGWAGALILAFSSLSCDALNPALVGDLGGDAGSVGRGPTGSVVLVLNNQTSQELALQFDVKYTRAGEATTTQEAEFTAPAGGWWTMTLDCDTSAVILKQVAPVGGDDGIPVAVNEFRRPALQCGSVIFVNVPLLGSPTADLLP